MIPLLATACLINLLSVVVSASRDNYIGMTTSIILYMVCVRVLAIGLFESKK